MKGHEFMDMAINMMPETHSWPVWLRKTARVLFPVSIIVHMVALVLYFVVIIIFALGIGIFYTFPKFMWREYRN